MSFRETIKRIKPIRDLGRACKDMLWSVSAVRKGSFAQNGEDRAILEMFPAGTQGTYVDLGANHPYRISNTYLLYRKGWHGICVDPIPTLARLHRRYRPRDLFLNVGVGAEPGDFDFYEMSCGELSTFSADIARELVAAHRATIIHKHKVRTLPVEEIVASRFGDGVFDVLSLDVEGLDMEIVRRTDWNKVRPKVVLCETSSFEHDWAADIRRLFAERGYRHEKHIGCNDIFVRSTSANPS